MKPTIETTMIALTCVAGGALFAFAFANTIASVGGATLLPMGVSAFTASGALMGTLLAGMTATRTAETTAS